jgi:hypothetical protein
MLEKLKSAVRYRPWVTGHLAFLLSQVFDHERNTRLKFSDDDHLRAAARWLTAAQDSQQDGGIAGRYRLGGGWTSSYPETTGYIIPTLLAKGGTFQFAAPNVRSDRPVSYVATFYANNSYQQELAETKITMAPTVTSNPTQLLPAALAADPFVPAHVVMVCASGCDYTPVGDATFNAGWEFVKIVVVKAEEYEYPAYALGASYPPHTWIHGVSVDGRNSLTSSVGRPGRGRTSSSSTSTSRRTKRR